MLILLQNDNMSEFERRFKELLKQRGLKQEDVAFDLRWDPGKLSKIVLGKKPRTEDYLRAIAAHQGLNISYEILLTWRLLDEYPPEMLANALKALEDEGVI